MAIKSSHGILWNVKNMNLYQLKEAVECLKPSADVDLLCIDVDINWLAYVLGRGRSPKEIVVRVSNFLKVLDSCIPAVVTPMLGGEARHYSKKDLTKWKAKKEKDWIDLMVAHCSAVALSSKMDGDKATVED
eukprot:10324767-Ditylum_brightwellii.AAC.1